MSYTDCSIKQEGTCMAPMSVEKSIANAIVSLRMEGLAAKPVYEEFCRQLLRGEITMSEYVALAIERKGS